MDSGAGRGGIRGVDRRRTPTSRAACMTNLLPRLQQSQLHWTTCPVACFRIASLASQLHCTRLQHFLFWSTLHSIRSFAGRNRTFGTASQLRFFSMYSKCLRGFVTCFFWVAFNKRARSTIFTNCFTVMSKSDEHRCLKAFPLLVQIMISFYFL